MCATLMCLRSPRWSVTDSRDKRRAQIVFGAGVAFFRVISLLPFVQFFVLIPGGRLTTAAFIGNANGSKAVTLAFSLPTVGLRVGVLTGLVAGQGELSEGLRRWAAAQAQSSSVAADAAQPDQRRTSMASTAPRAAKRG